MNQNQNEQNTQNDKDIELSYKILNILFWIPFALVFLFFGYMLFHMYQNSWTQDKVNKIAQTPMDDLAAPTALKEADWWGNPLIFEREVTDNYVKQIVISVGHDAKLKTKDDIVGIHTDWNKSKIVGKWTRDKGTEFIKGLLTNEPNRHEKLKEKREKDEKDK